MSKYHNRKVTVDGITFDSVKEANRYKDLKILERAGQIHDLQLQVKFKLIPAQREWTDETTKSGKPKKGKVIEHECSYIADFTYKNRFRIVCYHKLIINYSALQRCNSFRELIKWHH